MNFRVYLAAVASASLFFSCTKPYNAVVTFTEPDEPTELSTAEQQRWDSVPTGLNAAWASADIRYLRANVPTETYDTLRLTAWKGERESAQILLWSADSISGVTCNIADFKSARAVLPSSIASARFVRYALADSAYKIGFPTDSAGKALLPDMIDSLKVFDMQGRTARPVWLTVTVPDTAQAGIYTTTVTVSSANGDHIALPLTLEVQNHTLPPARQWAYHLDLWQHPAAVARAEGVATWSDEHFEALKPLMTRLADAGQKVITATLNKDPWNHQCYDAYEPMITWQLNADGTWSYNYQVFDRWVELMLSLGIDKMINCYSMVPWNCELEYFDEAAQHTVTVKADPGSDEFNRIWPPFLTDFKAHLAQKGWQGITNIAMDERSPEAMDATVKIINRYAPELGLALADDHKSYRRYPTLRDICINMNHPADPADISQRRANGLNTTFYVCCGPSFPNTFTFSDPYEAELLGWYGIAADFDGMLRWTYNSWPANPQTDGCFGLWSSGDTFMVYPGNRSSMRFERLIDGIETAEKVKLLRASGADMSEIDSILPVFLNGQINNPGFDWRSVTSQARAALNQASR
ncbi:MAG: DUF4091 domain-containing protein [Muribaculum sp.]|nr:DUF4091 domain-containing protein [Muribaculaceae bacterium]MCM1080793.1 DUF4091 domain-containing protein [Muribaculum sp.]